MAANYEEILKLIVDAGESVNTIEGLKKRIDELKKEMATMTIGGQDYVATKQKVDQLSKAQRELSTQTIQASNSIKTASKEVKGFGDAATISGGAAIALGQAFSDIGQFGVSIPNGIRAIANNISQLATLFAMLAVKTGGVGKAFKSLWASMMGPLGIVVAIQAVVGAIDLWANYQRKAKEETDKATESINEEIFVVNSMYEAYRKMNPSTDEARKLKKRLSDQLKVNVEDYKDLGKALADHIKLMALVAESTDIATQQKKDYANQLMFTTRLAELDVEITQQKERAEREKSTTIQSSLGNMRTEQKQLDRLILLRQNLIDKINKQTNDRLKLEQRQAKLQEEINKLTKEGNDEDDKKKKNLDDEKKAFKDLQEQYFLTSEELAVYIELLNKFKERVETTGLSSEAQAVRDIDKQYEDLFLGLDRAFANNIITEQEYLAQSKEFQEQYLKEIDALREESNAKAEKSTKKRVKKEIDWESRKRDAISQLASNTFGFLISLNQALAGETEKERKKAFQRDKALRIAQATIDTYAAANNALTTPAPPPIPQIFAAAAIAAGLANVATIAGTQFNGNTSSAPPANGGIQGGYPYPMSGFSTIDPQFPDRTGSLNIIPRTQRIVVLEADITGAQKTSIDREQKAKVG